MVVDGTIETTNFKIKTQIMQRIKLQKFIQFSPYSIVLSRFERYIRTMM
jgi:hypothetical protein